MRILIFCNGNIANYQTIKKYAQKGSYVIAVDGGVRHVRKLGLTPQVIIGDMDSISPTDKKYYQSHFGRILSLRGSAIWRRRSNLSEIATVASLPRDDKPYKTSPFKRNESIQWLTFPKNKDQTDSELALDYAVKHGANEIFVLGSSGTRIDHFLALLLHIRKYKNTAIKIITNDQVLQIIYQTITIHGKKGDIFSIVPLETVSRLTIKGAKYELKNATLNFGTTQGVSNEFVGSPVIIKVKKGALLLVTSLDLFSK